MRIPESPTAAEARAEKLDDLFLRLKKARAPRDAEQISAQIWKAWGDSGDDSINLLLVWADEAAKARNFGAAFDLVDQAILKRPDFAEAWNKRATFHFMTEAHAQSMADIERVLALEPRHFGAISGMAAILRAAGEDEQAMKAYGQVLEIYPANRAAQQAYLELAESLAGSTL